jgi:hypothetical protein
MPRNAEEATLERETHGDRLNSYGALLPSVQPGTAREAELLERIDAARARDRDPRSWDTVERRRRDRQE